MEVVGCFSRVSDMVEILDMAKVIRGGQHNLTWLRLVGMLDYLAIVNVIKHGQYYSTR